MKTLTHKAPCIPLVHYETQASLPRPLVLLAVHTYTHVHTCTTYTCTHIICTHIHRCIHACTHTHSTHSTHTCAYSYTHTVYAHTHTHTHMFRVHPATCILARTLHILRVCLTRVFIPLCLHNVSVPPMFFGQCICSLALSPLVLKEAFACFDVCCGLCGVCVCVCVCVCAKGVCVQRVCVQRVCVCKGCVCLPFEVLFVWMEMHIPNSAHHFYTHSTMYLCLCTLCVCVCVCVCVCLCMYLHAFCMDDVQP